ncbi:hypothetical protein P8631_22390, partial [Guyparkeria sp. 1SP6A2]|nr:hypothetical protein [Guyparkeria sp. 1SP6A2]
TVFDIGFPTSILVGLTLLMVLMTDLGSFLQQLFSQGVMFTQGHVAVRFYVTLSRLAAKRPATCPVAGRQFMGAMASISP